MSFNLPPGIDPSKVPLLPPPPGQFSNFVNPSPDRTAGFIAAITVLYVAMVLVTITRIWVRVVILREPGWDDFFAFLTWAVVTGEIGATYKLIAAGFGRHAWDVPLSNFITDPGFPHAQLATELLVPFTSAFLKLTVLCLLLRIFPYRVRKSTAIPVWVGIGIVSLFNVIILITYFVACVPRGIFNTEHAISPAQCQTKYGDVPTAVNGFNWIMDLYIFVIPLRTIWGLQLSAKRRIGITLVLSAGLAACVCSILTFAFRIQASSDPDITWAEVPAIIAQSAELCIGAIAAGMPCLTAFWAHIKDFRSTRGESGTSRARFLISGTRTRSLKVDGAPPPGNSSRQKLSSKSSSEEGTGGINRTVSYTVTSEQATHRNDIEMI